MYVNYACHTWMAWPRFALWYCGWSSHWNLLSTSSRLSSWFIDSRRSWLHNCQVSECCGSICATTFTGKESAGLEVQGTCSGASWRIIWGLKFERAALHSNKVEWEFTPSRAYNRSFQSFARFFLQYFFTINTLQGGPLLIINGYITPANGQTIG